MVHSYHVFDIFLLLLSCLRSTYFEIQLRSFQGSHEETQSQIVFSFLQLAPPSCLYVAGHVRSISSRFWMAAGSTLSSHMDLIRYGEAVMSSWLSPLSAVVNTESYTHRDVTARCNFLLILSIHFGSNKNFYLSKSSCYTIVTSKSMH